MTDAVRVANAAQAGLLLDVELRPVTTALMGRACSAAELGRALGVGVQRSHYLLGKLVAADIAQLDSVQPRAGRAVKRYRMAPRWFVPFEVTENETLDAFLAAQILPRMQRLVNLSVRQLGAAFETWGYWIEQEGEGSNLYVGNPSGAALALFEGDEPFLFSIGPMWLSPANATALKHRLSTLMTEFAALEDRDQQPYTVGIQLVRGEVG